MKTGRPVVDLTNKIFGYLTVQKLSFKKRIGKNTVLYWKCACVCGRSKDIAGKNLKSGTTISCGCKRKANQKAAVTKHGHATSSSPSPTYKSWRSMLARCTKEGINGYKDYGGRGIKVCRRWRKFSNFLEDMGERPTGHTIERKDTNGDYTAGNCTWATADEQQNNKRNNVFVAIDGTRLTLASAARELGMSPSNGHAFLKRVWTSGEVPRTVLVRGAPRTIGPREGRRG